MNFGTIYKNGMIISFLGIINLVIFLLIMWVISPFLHSSWGLPLFTFIVIQMFIFIFFGIYWQARKLAEELKRAAKLVDGEFDDGTIFADEFVIYGDPNELSIDYKLNKGRDLGFSVHEKGGGWAIDLEIRDGPDGKSQFDRLFLSDDGTVTKDGVKIANWSTVLKRTVDWLIKMQEAGIDIKSVYQIKDEVTVDIRPGAFDAEGLIKLARDTTVSLVLGRLDGY